MTHTEQLAAEGLFWFLLKPILAGSLATVVGVIGAVWLWEITPYVGPIARVEEALGTTPPAFALRPAHEISTAAP